MHAHHCPNPKAAIYHGARTSTARTGAEDSSNDVTPLYSNLAPPALSYA